MIIMEFFSHPVLWAIVIAAPWAYIAIDVFERDVPYGVIITVALGVSITVASLGLWHGLLALFLMVVFTVLRVFAFASFSNSIVERSVWMPPLAVLVLFALGFFLF